MAASIVVWDVDLGAPHAGHARRLSLLSPDERERAARFVFEPHRRRYVMARAALRELLGRSVGRPADKLVFGAGRHGKPHLAGGPCFNITHAGDRALIAVGRAPLGVDLEPLSAGRPDIRVVRRILAPEERALGERLARPGAQHERSALWTAKEAVVKGLGEGLGFGLERVALSLDPLTLVAIAGDRDAGRAWRLHRLDAGPDWSAALATSDTAAGIDLRRWIAPNGKGVF